MNKINKTEQMFFTATKNKNVVFIRARQPRRALFEAGLGARGAAHEPGMEGKYRGSHDSSKLQGFPPVILHVEYTNTTCILGFKNTELALWSKHYKVR